jgi:A/G-specific adenine glycosylase
MRRRSSYSEVTPVVDGNVIRVLSRLRRIAADPKNRDAVALIWQLAAELVDPARPGCFNQVLLAPPPNSIEASDDAIENHA